MRSSAYLLRSSTHLSRSGPLREKKHNDQPSRGTVRTVTCIEIFWDRLISTNRSMVDRTVSRVLEEKFTREIRAWFLQRFSYFYSRKEREKWQEREREGGRGEREREREPVEPWRRSRDTVDYPERAAHINKAVFAGVLAVAVVYAHYLRENLLKHDGR